MTQPEIITTIIAAAVVWSVAIAAHAWRTTKTHQSDNWLTANREGMSAQRNIIRDATRNQETT